jgi:hypothetical protein
MHPMVLPLLALLFQAGPARPADVPFQSHAIDPGASESAAVADIDRDGRLDIVSGEFWYRAPAWTRHRFREVGFSGNYIDSFSLMPLDVDRDGHVDLVDVSWFAKRIAWWRNPGRHDAPALWAQADVNACCNVEFALLADMNNDGRIEEIVAQENGTGQAWYEARDGRWVRHVVSDRTYGHGIGYGDVNGDGRNDILTPAGWLEAPADPATPGWTFHDDWSRLNTAIAPSGPPSLPAPVPPATTTGAVAAPTAAPRPLELGFMHVMDVNDDGRNDVVTAAGHDYGVFWFEQTATGWTRRTIDNSWSQGHASALIDIDGDGRRDFVTGKRFMAHNGADPGEREPLGLYWYQSRVLAPPTGAARPAAPRVEWIKHVIEYGGRIGAGMQVVAPDLDGDGDVDLVVAGKSGLFWLENRTSAK